VNESYREKLESLGVERVRVMLQSSHINIDMVQPALEWLSERDAEERVAKERSQSSQMRTALSAKRAAWIAAIAAIIAAIVTIAGIAVSVLAWLYPRAPAP